ncbi:MAG TPA: hypothetical protein V6D37_07215 [Candidatus Sericytochromatia bacterium]
MTRGVESDNQERAATLARLVHTIRISVNDALRALLSLQCRKLGDEVRSPFILKPW